jgi:uncharacterized membrane protein
MSIQTEIYQFLFISSIIFIIYTLGGLIIKMYGRFKLNKETKFMLTTFEKFALWVSLGIFITYLIQ